MDNNNQIPFANEARSVHLADDFYGNKYDIISQVAYLLGVPKAMFEKEPEPPQLHIFENLDKNKHARIIRHLCILRTATERKYSNIISKTRMESKSLLAMPEFIPFDSILQLERDGVRFGKHAVDTPNHFIIELNRVISDRINNCKSIFPVWLNWAYIHNIFIMPNGLTEEGIKTSGKIFLDNLEYFPYFVYMNIPLQFKGNLLYHDKRFVCLLYEWNNDTFVDLSKVSDVGGTVKSNIYDFICDAEKVVMVVDCENSDPYRLCATMKGLDATISRKIQKIILFDDVHTDNIWRIVESHTDVPVEHLMTERVKQSKSLVDIELTARACKEHYKNHVDSIIIVSSDSDYWGLISSLPDARFLLMAEREKFGFDMKNALFNNNIFYCYMDDFYDGNCEAIKKSVLFHELYRGLEEAVQLNVLDLFKNTLFATHIDMTAAEQKQFYEKHIRQMRLVVDDDGRVSFELKV